MTQSSGNTDLLKSLPVTEDGPRRVLTLRSFGIGALLSALIAAVAPFNDSVVANSYLIGSYLPPALVLSCFVLIVMLNAPLHRLRPQWAFSAGELSVILAMLLVACAIPGQGLMRQLIPVLVSSHQHGSSDPQFWNYFASLGLPSWLFPERSFDPAATTSSIISWFYRRVPEDQSIPFAAWVVPLAGWGIFFAAMFAVLLAMAEILHQQWAVNERLAFPLAQLQLALIEPPERGRGLNTLFRSRSFWLATIAVFIAHSLTVLHGYIVSIPALPLSWNLSGILSEPPWTYMHQLVKTGQIYFTFIGVTYFIQSRIALSLWAVFMIQQTVNMQLEVVGASVPPLAWKDQHLGAGAALLLGVLWTGRHHWMLVLRQVTRGVRPGEPMGLFVSHRIAATMIAVGLVVMAGWLWVVGAGLMMTAIIVAFIIGSHIIIARIVAETGMPFMRATADIDQVYLLMPANTFSGRDIFFAGALTLTGPLASRESVLTFASHGMTLVEQSTQTRDARPSRLRGILAAMVTAIAISAVVSAASSLWCQYRYAVPLTSSGNPTMLNGGSTDTWPRHYITSRLKQHEAGRFPPASHNSALHIGIGATITSALQFATWRWTSWPLVPVGYVVSGTWYVQAAWFSIFLGWLAKLLLVRFGGSSMFKAAKPFFIGLIFGEALAVGVWLLISMALAVSGYEYVTVTILPR